MLSNRHFGNFFKSFFEVEKVAIFEGLLKNLEIRKCWYFYVEADFRYEPYHIDYRIYQYLEILDKDWGKVVLRSSDKLSPPPPKFCIKIGSVLSACCAKKITLFILDLNISRVPAKTI